MKLYRPKDRILLLGAVLLGGLTAVLSAFISILLQKVIDVVVSGNIAGFYRQLVIMLVYLAALGITSFLEAIVGKLLVRNVTRHLRNGIFNGVLNRNPVTYASQNTADYLSALSNDVKLVEENYLLPLLLCSQMAVMFVTTLGILLWLSPLVTVVLLCFLVLLFAVPALLGKKLQKRQDAYSQQLSSFTGAAKDFFNGYEVIRGYSAHRYILGRFFRINQETADKKYAADRLMAVNECFSDIFSSLIIIVIVFIAAWQLMQGKITMGTLLALIQLSGTFVTPVVLLLQNFPKIQGIKPVLMHLSGLMEKEGKESSGNTKDDQVDKVQENSKNAEAVILKDCIKCSGLTYGYTEEQQILKHKDFCFESGKKYAVTGPSGCGKSTLIKLLCGYSADFEGEITADGKSIKAMEQQELNRLIAVIHQNVFLFDTDIRDNICLGQNFSTQEIEGALRESGIWDFVSTLKEGIYTKVGENGQLLSGGQRQRIAVARALIRRTPVLILDEGTSAIDQETAFEIEQNLLSRKDLTLITITHHMDKRLKGYYDEIVNLGEADTSPIDVAYSSRE